MEDGEEDLERQGYVAFQKRKKFDNIYQEKADRVRRLHAPRFGKYYKDPDRPIHASEIKSWFHAWLGKQHLSANYDYQSSMSLNSKGGQEHQFTVECTVTGFKHTARARYHAKKECQTAATWLMIDWMILNNHIDPRLIPFEKEDIYVDIKHVNLEGDENENQRTIYTKKMRFVKAGKLSTDGSEQLEEGDPNKRDTWEHSAPSDIERAQKTVEMIFGGNSKPIGMEYLEYLQGSGKNRWHCRLCDTEVTDEAGKAMHVRGRKHKLNYKRFVDPDLGIGKLSADEERILKTDVLEYQKTLAAEHKTKAAELANIDTELMHHENLEDFCATIYEDFLPDEREEYKKLNKTVEFKCPSLKHIYSHACKLPISDNEKLVRKKVSMLIAENPINNVMLQQLMNFEKDLTEIFKMVDSENPNSAWMSWPKPVYRTGTFVKNVARADDKDKALSFICMCERHPTRELVQAVVEKVRVKCNPRDSEVVLLDIFPSYFTMSFGGKARMVLPVHFTSNKLFNQVALIPKYYGTPISRDTCIKLLMEIKRKEYYIKNFKMLPGYLDCYRVMRDIAKRSKAWAEVDGWALEVIVRNALAGSSNVSSWPSRNGPPCYEGIPMQPQPMDTHACLKRVMEYIGSGALTLYGLLDPVQLANVDRQVLKKLVGYDEDEVVAMEQGPEMPTVNIGIKKTEDEIIAEEREKRMEMKRKQAAEEHKTQLEKSNLMAMEEMKKSIFDEHEEPEKEEQNKEEEAPLKPRARKRERKSKFGKKAAEYQVAPVSTVKVVKKGDVALADNDDEKWSDNENNDNDDKRETSTSASEPKRPKMMNFVKAGETKVTSGLENLEKDETVNDVVEVTEEERNKRNVEKLKESGVTKKTLEGISQAIENKPKVDELEDCKGTDGTVATGLHVDLIGSLRPQHIENLTASAHTILRMLNFNWTHKVLGVSANVITAMELEELRIKEEQKRAKLSAVKDLKHKHIDFSKDGK